MPPYLFIPSQCNNCKLNSNTDGFGYFISPSSVKIGLNPCITSNNLPTYKTSEFLPFTSATISVDVTPFHIRSDIRNNQLVVSCHTYPPTIDRTGESHPSKGILSLEFSTFHSISNFFFSSTAFSFWHR